MLPEPYNTLLFVLLVPVAIQLIKLVAAKFGKDLATKVVHALAIVGGAAIVFLSGGFAQVQLPPLGDFAAFLAALPAFITAVGLVTSAIVGAYELLLKRLMEGIGFAVA